MEGVPDKDAERYIKKRLSKVNINIEKDSLNKILDLCQGRPYYIQLVCSKCYDICIKKSSKIINNEIFDNAIKNILDTPPTDLTYSFYKVTGTKTRQVFASLCIKDSAKKSSDLSEMLDMAPSRITQLLKQLHRIHNLVEPGGNFFKPRDNLLKKFIKLQFRPIQVTKMVSSL